MAGNAPVLWAAIAFVGGIAVPLLASINAAYGQAIGNVWWASLTLCAVAFVTILMVSLLAGSPLPQLSDFGEARWWHVFAGCFFAVYVTAITYVAPKIGVGNAIIFVVVAQIFTAVLIDHFGLFGAAIQTMSWQRALGIVFLIAGVALARSVSSPPAPGAG